MNEIEDYEWFNAGFPGIANGMLYDMSYSQRYKTTQLPDSFIEQIDTNYVFLDIGSGGGDATIYHLQDIFGEEVQIVLSDLHPKINLWNQLTNEKISYIREPLNATNLTDIPTEIKIISCFGSLHHMDPATVEKIFHQIKVKEKIFFIIEPCRYCTILQYLHILTLPIFGFLFYTIVCLFGSVMVALDPVSAFLRFLLVPFFMTFDHILGASRRYSVERIRKIGSLSALKTYHHSDGVFDYYILR